MQAAVELLATRSPGTTTWPRCGEARIATPADRTIVRLLHPQAATSPPDTIGVRWSGSLDAGNWGSTALRVETTLAYLRAASAWIRLPAEPRGVSLTTPGLPGAAPPPGPLGW